MCNRYSQSWTTIATNFKTFHHPKKELVYPLTVTHSLLIPGPGKSYSIFYFCVFVYSEISYKWNHRCMPISVWLFSLSTFLKFIYVMACISELHLFLWLNDTVLMYIQFCLCIHQFVDIWIVTTFWLLWIMLLWTFMYKCLCRGIFLFSLSFGIAK